MIDAHCHLEQKEYEGERDAVIKSCKVAGLKAIVTSCARPKDFALTMDIARKYANFVFPTVGIHPEFIKEITSGETDAFFEIIRKNRESIVGIGETGLDYNWVKEPEWRERQKELFRQMIALAGELKKPLVIHAREAHEDVIDILEQEGAKRVQMHMFGANQLVNRVIDNGWHVSINAILLKSKKHKKVARDMPMDRLMLETDAPWLAPDGWSPDGKQTKRNDSRAIKQVAEKIAEVKKLKFEDVWHDCGKNTVRFFKLPVRV
jgi:TatD DNase family protein